MSMLMMPDPPPLPPGWSPAQIHTGTAHPARMYDYYLGGKDNYQVDRDAAEQILADFPQLREIATANRAFLQRAVRAVTASGITQIIDIGTGIPGNGDAAQAARALNPRVCVVAVDNDPIVITHARGRLDGLSAGLTSVLEADLRQPETILDDPKLHTVVDLAQPVALLMVSVLHFLPDRDQPRKIVNRLMAALAPGSYLVLSHATADGETGKAIEAAERYQQTQTPIILRSHPEIAAFFDGLTLLDPGLVKQPWWRPDKEPAMSQSLNWGYGGVAQKT